MFDKSKIGRLLIIFICVLAALNCGAAFAAEEYPNYIVQNEARYRQYAANNADKEYSDVLIAVNLKLDEKNYSNFLTTSNPSALNVFVSKHYALPKGYKPEYLIKVDKQYAYSGVRLRNDTYYAFLTMVQDMEKEGLSLYIRSGYRTNKKRGDANNVWYAWPGHSEHQTGLAFDLCKKNVYYKTLSEYKYHLTDEYKWLCENAHNYGFILSYPEGSTSITGFAFEPWHWRYVGITIAKDMKEKGFKTYHEYWATYLIQDAIGDYIDKAI